MIARKESLSRPDMKLATAIEIDIEADAQTNCTLDVSYIVPAACWRPQHTARLVSGDGGGQKVIFEVDGCVWQRTGEDWTDAKLRFLTPRMSPGTEPPLLSDDVLAVKCIPPEVDVEAREQKIQVAGVWPTSPTRGKSNKLEFAEDIKGAELSLNELAKSRRKSRRLHRPLKITEIAPPRTSRNLGLDRDETVPNRRNCRRCHDRSRGADRLCAANM